MGEVLQFRRRPEAEAEAEAEAEGSGRVLECFLEDGQGVELGIYQGETLVKTFVFNGQRISHEGIVWMRMHQKIEYNEGRMCRFGVEIDGEWLDFEFDWKFHGGCKLVIEGDSQFEFSLTRYSFVEDENAASAHPAVTEARAQSARKALHIV